jgi:Holliday junction resolvasome RuvABC endonuclease subunit
MAPLDSNCVLAVDPGLDPCGIVVVRRDGPRWRLVVSSAPTTASSEPPTSRLHTLWEQIRAIAEQTLPGLVAVEEQTGVQEGARRAGRTNAIATWSRDVATVVRAVGWSLGARVVDVSPQQAKLAVTASRTASKRQVQAAVQRMLGAGVELGEHESDAFAVAVAAERLARTGLGAHVPLVRRRPKSKRRQLQELVRPR